MIGRRLAAVALAALAGCAGHVDRRAEALIRESLPRIVGPAERYDVEVQGADLGASRFASVRVGASRVARERAPVLDRIDVELSDVVVDRQARRVVSVGDARGALRVRRDDLAAFIATQRWIDSPEVRFEAGSTIRVGGRLRLPSLDAFGPAAEVRGRLLADGPRIVLAIDSVRVGDRSMPALARAIVEGAVNPVFDASAHAVPSRIDAIRTDGDVLVVEASGSRMRFAPQAAALPARYGTATVTTVPAGSFASTVSDARSP